MMIAEEDLRRVKEATDIVAVINEKVGLKRSSSRWIGLCPFHAEKTPSFSVNPALGVYHCFGCGASGDAISFLRETQGLTFVEAVERLAPRAGVALQAEDPEQAKARQRRSALLDAMERAVAWYHDRLLTAPDASTARSYLRSRGYDGEVVRRYRLGWAPAGWDQLCQALRLPDDVLQGTGLGYVDDKRRRSDVFRERVLFPILDHQGAAIGIGGRQLPGGRDPKYKNSPETPLYRKKEVLYGLSWAKEHVMRHATAVLCEGYTDVIAFHQAGVASAVATCGTAATEDHVRRLKAFGATRLVLGYDADVAGQGAAERFHAWERSHDLDIRVVALPPGADPADVGRRDPTALQRAVEEAVPFLSFRLQRVWAGADLNSNEGRARAAQQAVTMIDQHPNPLVRDPYLMEVAARTRLDPARLRDLSREGRPGRADGAASQPGSLRRRTVELPRAERAALWFAVNHPEAVTAHLEEELFSHDVAIGAYRALTSSGTFAEAHAGADEDVATLLASLANEPDTGRSRAASLGRAFDELGNPLVQDDQATAAAVSERALDVIAELVRARATEIFAAARLLGRQPDLSAADGAAHTVAITFLQANLPLLSDRHRRAAALDQLVPWLVTHQRE
ncbi:MAG TPA: DNA primase [Acidimicrobiales bacterium]|nr:DNA primase [Acidimicrobiales bacterium]